MDGRGTHCIYSPVRFYSGVSSSTADSSAGGTAMKLGTPRAQQLARHGSHRGGGAVALGVPRLARRSPGEAPRLPHDLLRPFGVSDGCAIGLVGIKAAIASQ